MDQERLSEIRKTLENKQAELEKNIKNIKNELRTAERVKVSIGRRLSELHGVNESVQCVTDILLLKARGDELYKVKDALSRLKKGEYGNCDECDAEISEQRLNALPFTNLCISCQEELEKNGVFDPPNKFGWIG